MSSKSCFICSPNIQSDVEASSGGQKCNHATRPSVFSLELWVDDITKMTSLSPLRVVFIDVCNLKCLLPDALKVLTQLHVPSGKCLHNYGKSPFLIGKPSINGQFSIAMLVKNQRVHDLVSLFQSLLD